MFTEPGRLLSFPIHTRSISYEALSSIAPSLLPLLVRLSPGAEGTGKPSVGIDDAPALPAEMRLSSAGGEGR
jgi:hypothetical protein